MTMCSPYSVLEDLESKSYEELVKIRDEYLVDVKYFECHREEIMESDNISPSQDVIYSWNLTFLSGLLNLINEKFLQDNEDEL